MSVDKVVRADHGTTAITIAGRFAHELDSLGIVVRRAARLLDAAAAGRELIIADY